MGVLLTTVMFINCSSAQVRYPNMKKQIRISKKKYVVWVEDTTNQEIAYQLAWGAAVGKALSTPKVILPPIANLKAHTTKEIYDSAMQNNGKLKIKKLNSNNIGKQNVRNNFICSRF